MQREQKTSTLIFYGDKYFFIFLFFLFFNYWVQIIQKIYFNYSCLLFFLLHFPIFFLCWLFLLGIFFLGGGEFILRNPLSFTLSSMLSLRWRREGGCKIFIYRGVKLVNLPEFRYSSATITTLLPPIAAERFLIYILLNSE